VVCGGQTGPHLWRQPDVTYSGKPCSGACSKLEQTLYRWRHLWSIAVILRKYRMAQLLKNGALSV
jgi:hypothetical protein